jgi:hypothetical protein
MIYAGKGSEVVGVVFLYQLFNEMAEIKNKIEKKEEHIMAEEKEYIEGEVIEMEEIHRPLLN